MTNIINQQEVTAKGQATEEKVEEVTPQQEIIKNEEPVQGPAENKEESAPQIDEKPVTEVTQEPNESDENQTVAKEFI